jgi:hypothetical protein
MTTTDEKQTFMIDSTKQIVAALAAGYLANPSGSTYPTPDDLADHAYRIAEATYEHLKHAGWLGRSQP